MARQRAKGPGENYEPSAQIAEKQRGLHPVSFKIGVGIGIGIGIENNRWARTMELPRMALK
jgi:hypothetical protein